MNSKFAVISFTLGLIVGFICNIHVMAMSAAFLTGPPGFRTGAIGTALIALFFTAFGLWVNHMTWNKSISVKYALLPYAVGVFVFPAISFWSILAGVFSIVFTGVAIFSDISWRNRSSRKSNPSL